MLKQEDADVSNGLGTWKQWGLEADTSPRMLRMSLLADDDTSYFLRLSSFVTLQLMHNPSFAQELGFQRPQLPQSKKKQAEVENHQDWV